MSDVIAAMTEEIRVREQELETLRNALTMLQSDRQRLVQIVTGRDGRLAISNVFQPPADNGNDESILADAVAALDPKKGNSSRESTARLLTYFDRRIPRSLEQVAKLADISTRRIAIGVLTKHGYLKAKGDGYVRTAKEYTP